MWRHLKQTLDYMRKVRGLDAGHPRGLRSERKETDVTTVNSVHDVSIPLSSVKYALRQALTRRANNR